MIYRVVLAVVLATALLSVALPPLDDARRDRASATVAAQAADVERVATALVETDDPTSDSGARRIVSLRLPARQWTSATVEHVTFYPDTDGTPGRIAWQVRGGRTNARLLPETTIQTPDGTPLVLSESGPHRLVLALDGEAGAPVVTVRQLK